MDEANITSNKNPIPFDDANPNNWAGLRLGVSAATTRGFRQAEFQELGRVIAELLTSDESNRAARLGAAQSVTARLCEAHPIYTS